jgi:hypothetical protein
VDTSSDHVRPSFEIADGSSPPDHAPDDDGEDDVRDEERREASLEVEDDAVRERVCGRFSCRPENDRRHRGEDEARGGAD